VSLVAPSFGKSIAADAYSSSDLMPLMICARSMVDW
jgi:hypothetical protein